MKEESGYIDMRRLRTVVIVLVMLLGSFVVFHLLGWDRKNTVLSSPALLDPAGNRGNNP